MFEESPDNLGKPFECELNISPNTGVDVDLLSYDEKKDELYLIEVKGVKRMGNIKALKPFLSVRSKSKHITSH